MSCLTSYYYNTVAAGYLVIAGWHIFHLHIHACMHACILFLTATDDDGLCFFERERERERERSTGWKWDVQACIKSG